jgi:hypothetical protein
MVNLMAMTVFSINRYGKMNGEMTHENVTVECAADFTDRLNFNGADWLPCPGVG